MVNFTNQQQDNDYKLETLRTQRPQLVIDNKFPEEGLSVGDNVQFLIFCEVEKIQIKPDQDNNDRYFGTIRISKVQQYGKKLKTIRTVTMRIKPSIRVSEYLMKTIASKKPNQKFMASIDCDLVEQTKTYSIFRINSIVELDRIYEKLRAIN